MLTIKLTYGDKEYLCTMSDSVLEPNVTREEVLKNINFFMNMYLNDMNDMNQPKTILTTSLDEEIKDTEALRIYISELLEELNGLPTYTRSISNAENKLEEARMWLAKHLVEIGEHTPYMTGNDPSIPRTEPVADTWVDEDGYPEKVEEEQGAVKDGYEIQEEEVEEVELTSTLSLLRDKGLVLVIDMNKIPKEFSVDDILNCVEVIEDWE